MTRRARGDLSAIAALALAAGGCVYPSFEFSTKTTKPATTTATTTTTGGGAGGAGGGGGGSGGVGGGGSGSTTTATTTTTSTTSTTSSTGTTTGSGGGATTTTGSGGSGGSPPPTCGVDHLVISEVRTRGPGGASDEFIELYNPTPHALVLDDTWKVEARSWTAGSYGQRWNGDGATLGPHRHLLIAHLGPLAPDYDIGGFGVADGGSLRLTKAGHVVDAVCFYYDGPSLAALDDPSYDCEGTPISNLPHDNSGDGQSNSDTSLERKPGGGLGACQDTDDSLADFQAIKPARPETMASPAVP